MRSKKNEFLEPTLNDIDKPENYIEAGEVYSRKEILKMHEDGIINQVKRETP